MADAEWFLLKHNDKQTHGPVSLTELKSWAVAAKISPMDRVSNDNKTSWSRAPMIPELQMDWLVELDDNYLYGPTSIATIQEFISSGEIHESDTIINCLENKRMKVIECPAFTNFLAKLKNEAAQQSDAEVEQPKRMTPTVEGQGHPVTIAARLSYLETAVGELRSELAHYQEILVQLHEKLLDSRVNRGS